MDQELVKWRFRRRAGRIGAWVLFATAFCRALPAAEEFQPRPWTEYRTIMWIGETAYRQPGKLPLFFQRLREMGINTGVVHGDGDPSPLVEAKLPYYVENMVNNGLCLKWNSEVRDWDKMVTAWKDRRDEAGLVRQYGLDDPSWRAWARGRMQELVRKNAPNQPLAYDIRDELSTTISANPFDYDFGPTALAAFRQWLRTRYADLAALNREWETNFAAWDDVKPFTTDQIKNRMASGDANPRGEPDWQAVQRIQFDPIEARKNPTAWNFAPWADHRTYMDVSFAAVLDDLRQVAHALDSRTPVGIEGTQMPSAFGGYDLWRLAQVLDWVEPYDVGNAREIWASFMPGKPVLTTVGEQDARAARRRLWHLLLEGDRGCIVWWSEDCIDWKSADYKLTPRAKALAPVLAEMTSPLARLFLRAQREFDPIAIHYSQPSVQVDWLLESAVDGSTWLRRFSSYEAGHNRMAQVRDAWLKAFRDLGFTPRFISSAQIEAGELRDVATLVLPASLALSDREAIEIGGMIADSKRVRTVFSDGSPGLFDEHARLRPRSVLDGIFPPAASTALVYAVGNDDAKKSESKSGDIARYSTDRLTAEPPIEWLDWIGAHTRQLRCDVSVSPAARTRVHRYRLGPARLVAFERNVSYRMSDDLQQAGGNAALERHIDLEARLAQPAHIYDLRSGKYLGQLDRIAFRLDPWQPSLFALLPQKLPDGDVIEALEKLAAQPE